MNISSELTVTEVDAFRGKIYDSRILLFHEIVPCESFVVNNNIWWKLLTIEPTQLAS
jgi:hypothetical protein